MIDKSKNIKANKKEISREVKVNPTAYRGSTFSQATSITVTDNDITLDFIYIHPNMTVTEGHIVSRVTMPTHSALEMIRSMQETLKKHAENKKNPAK